MARRCQEIPDRCAACTELGLAAPNTGPRQGQRGTAVKPQVSSLGNSASRRYAKADGASVMITRTARRPNGSQVIVRASEFLQVEVGMAGSWRGALRLRVHRVIISVVATLMVYSTIGFCGAESREVHDLYSSWKAPLSLERCAACTELGLAAPNTGPRQGQRGTAVKPQVSSLGNSASRRYAKADGASPSLSAGPFDQTA
jgi:hypothetical protein